MGAIAFTDVLIAYADTNQELKSALKEININLFKPTKQIEFEKMLEKLNPIIERKREIAKTARIEQDKIKAKVLSEGSGSTIIILLLFTKVITFLGGLGTAIGAEIVSDANNCSKTNNKLSLGVIIVLIIAGAAQALEIWASRYHKHLNQRAEQLSQVKTPVIEEAERMAGTLEAFIELKRVEKAIAEDLMSQDNPLKDKKIESIQPPPVNKTALSQSSLDVVNVRLNSCVNQIKTMPPEIGSQPTPVERLVAITLELLPPKHPLRQAFEGLHPESSEKSFSSNEVSRVEALETPKNSNIVVEDAPNDVEDAPKLPLRVHHGSLQLNDADGSALEFLRNPTRGFKAPSSGVKLVKNENRNESASQSKANLKTKAIKKHFFKNWMEIEDRFGVRLNKIEGSEGAINREGQRLPPQGVSLDDLENAQRVESLSTHATAALQEQNPNSVVITIAPQYEQLKEKNKLNSSMV